MKRNVLQQAADLREIVSRKDYVHFRSDRNIELPVTIDAVQPIPTGAIQIDEARGSPQLRPRDQRSRSVVKLRAMMPIVSPEEAIESTPPPPPPSPPPPP